jgi:hypothetical protein
MHSVQEISDTISSLKSQAPYICPPAARPRMSDDIRLLDASGILLGEYLTNSYDASMVAVDETRRL